nr:uncharacterized protein LOC129255674 [Lytechinus pictus]
MATIANDSRISETDPTSTPKATSRGRKCPPQLSLLCAGGVGKRDGGLSQNTMSKNDETFRKEYLLDSLEGFRQSVCPFDSVIERFSQEQQLELWQIIEDFAERNGLDLR